MARWRNEQGAVAVLTAVLLVVILLCAALVVDLGHLHNVKVQMQRAADAAALAGAHQLDGGENQAGRANAAAQAALGANLLDGGAANDPGQTVEITLGSWDTESLGAPAAVRFAAGGTPATAVRVSLTAEVPHVLFFFAAGSPVSADAIAVNLFERRTFPFVLVSCIHTDDTYLKPGENVCDINFFRWGPDPTDTGGWTSLSFRPANNPNIEQFFSEEGNRLFNRLIYGTGEAHAGLENTAVAAGPLPFDAAAFDSAGMPLCGERNVETNIVCGLGADFDAANLPLPSDPLGYGALNSLPRWYHDDADPDAFSATSDHFTRLWSVGGVLLQGETEAAAAFETRLQALQAAAETGNYTAYETAYGTLPAAYKDGRFSRFIGKVGGDTVPLYDEVLRYAGYPLVETMNGVVNAALQEFLAATADAATHTFLAQLTEENFPFDAAGVALSNGRGETFLLTLPVIFSGSCERWKALGGLPYAGLANLLVTRIWRGNNDGYDAGETAVRVEGSPADCTFPNFNPPNPRTTADGRFRFVTGHGAGIEGLIQPPTRGDISRTGIRKIYLVE